MLRPLPALVVVVLTTALAAFVAGPAGAAEAVLQAAPDAGVQVAAEGPVAPLPEPWYRTPGGKVLAVGLFMLIVALTAAFAGRDLHRRLGERRRARFEAEMMKTQPSITSSQRRATGRS